MSVKVTVGQPALTLNKGSTFMVTDYNGEIDPQQAQGVFADDTRYVSGYRLRVNGRSWQYVSAAAVSYHAARLYLTNPSLEGFPDEAKVTGGVLGLTLLRAVEDGVHEQYEVTNYAPHPVRVVLELELESDFADLFEVKAGHVRQRRNLVTLWDTRHVELTTSYHHADFLRRFTYKLINISQPPTYANGRIWLPIELDPGQSWRACGHMHLQHEQHVRKPRGVCSPGRAANGHTGRLQRRWIEVCTSLDTPNHDVNRTYRQSVEDLGALRLHEQDLGPDVWVPAAGVPWFVTLFGRDSLIASLQNLAVHARFAEGTLRVLAEHQARERNDWRDAQPGKIVHELRHGELAHFNRVPHTRYYGAWDATPLFLIVLHQAWRWLGDRGLVEDLRAVAERCLEWIDRYGDLDGDGFQEYKTFSPQGYNNMSWKDAADAVVYPDGRPTPQPKALCELQGYVYAAKLGMAELYDDVFGDGDRADLLRRQAKDLRRRFNERFWLEDEGTFAFGLDPDKRPIMTVASNAGHCLWSGIADPEKAERVAARLLAPDMWSGWGIRTLSAANPAYDPFSYQRGSVWPHDNGIIAAGMKRYGLADEANRVARAILDAASYFEGYRLPEVFAGLGREPQSFPVQYRGANVPQAWAAGSVFQLVQAMLGLEADVPRGRLYVNPTLPDWLPALDLTGLMVGDARLDLHFRRERAHTAWSVERRRGRIEVCDGPAPKPDAR
ncbi:MAG: glycogen debranching N-terminal domain-containing protein [Dehalococcoidia bacterium]